MTSMTLFRLLLICCYIVLNRGQVRFREGDFPSSGNVTLVTVDGPAGASVTIRPMTISDYMNSGGSGCVLSGTENPAEAEDFDATPLSETIPAGSTSITFEVHLPQDVVVENEETFVAILEAGSGVTLGTRTCTVIRISEFFTGRLLRWVYNGREVISQMSLEFQEDSGSHVIMTAERLVEAEEDVTITVSRISGIGTNLNFASSYKIPPQNSSVDIVVEITDDLLAEKDQMVLFNMIASYPGVTIPNTDLRRTVAVTILDNEVVNFEILAPGPQVSIIEGEDVTVTVGMNPVMTYSRTEVASLVTENGTALAGIDFAPVNELVIINPANKTVTITTQLLPGVQPTRSFTVRLLALSLATSIHNNTHISGTITVTILDTPIDAPLAPSISNANIIDKDSLNTSWSHDTDDSRPVDNFILIIRLCSKSPCEVDSDSPKPGDIMIRVTTENLELLRKIDSKESVLGIVVCAENSKGRNCSSTYEINREPPKPTQGLQMTTPKPVDNMIVVVIVCVLLLLLCCCCVPFFLFLIIFCWWRRDKERSYFPKKNMGRQLKGKSPDSSTSDSIKYYDDEVRYPDLKYL